MTPPSSDDRVAHLRGHLRVALEGAYEIGEVLGEGAMAVVFAVRDRSRGRELAMKVLRPQHAGSELEARFRQEVSQLARLMHPGLLPVLDAGEAAGLPWYTMPRAEGATLRDRLLSESQLGVADVLRVGVDVADALGYAHEHGLVHRDVKPENILFTGARAVLVDFGHARVDGPGRDAADRMTSPHTTVGTAEYMSPEVAAGADADARSDVYALGCVLYEMLAGEPPFHAVTRQAVMTKHISAPVPTIEHDRPGLDTELQALLRRMLSKAPADRPASAHEVRAELERLRSGTARTPVPRRTRSLVMGVGVAVALGAGVWVFRPGGPVKAPEVSWPVTAIAILPFSDLSPDRRLGWLSEGLTNELIDALASVEQLDVRTFEAARRALADSGGNDGPGAALRVGSLVTGTLEALEREIVLTVRVSDALQSRAIGGGSIRLAASAERPDSLRFALVERVALELRRMVGEQLELRRVPDRGLQREAWEHFSRAEQLNRSVARAIAAGAGREALRDFGRADTLYTRAAAIESDWVAPVVGRAWLYEYHARFVSDTLGNVCGGECVRWREAALALTAGLPADAVDAQELMGAVELELARVPSLQARTVELMDRGEARLLSVIQRDSSRARSWILLSTLRGRQGNAPGALDALRQAERADPWMTVEPEVLERWGTNLRAVGDYDEAARRCEMGRARYPQRRSFQECRLAVLGERGRGAGDIAAAWAEMEAVTRANADTAADVTWWYRRAMVAVVLARSGLTDSAYSVLRASRTQRPTSDPNLFFQEAQAAAAAEDWSTALQFLTRYLDLVPGRVQFLARERRFAGLRGTAAFEALLESARRRNQTAK